MRNIIVAQSGGPTAAINASLAGVIERAVSSGKYDKVYGALHGISGVIKDDLIDITRLVKDIDETSGQKLLDMLYKTPSSFLGSCRYKMPEMESDREIYGKIFDTFARYEVDAFFYIGGNDSMDTVAKLSEYGRTIGSNIRFAGVPKTIDNDLVCTDHTPGYGSAAKFIATSMLEIGHDTAVYEAPCVTIVEIMGRNAGWLTAAAALARNSYNPAPQLLYLPEVAFDTDSFIDDIREVMKTTNNVVVAVSEGIHDASGAYVSATSATNDRFGHAQLSGAGKYLEGLVKERLGIKCRSVELNILQRCAAHISSAKDLEESFQLGSRAVDYTIEGNTGFMTTLKRTSDEPYTCSIELAELVSIANAEKTVPRSWINESGNDVTAKMVDYIRPLIQGEVEVSYKNGIPEYLSVIDVKKQ